MLTVTLAWRTGITELLQETRKPSLILQLVGVSPTKLSVLQPLYFTLHPIRALSTPCRYKSVPPLDWTCFDVETPQSLGLAHPRLRQPGEKLEPLRLCSSPARPQPWPLPTGTIGPLSRPASPISPPAPTPTMLLARMSLYLEGAFHVSPWQNPKHSLKPAQLPPLPGAPLSAPPTPATSANASLPF